MFAVTAVSRRFLSRNSRGYWLCVALVIGILLVPLLLTPLPQLDDYPNHLARAYLIAFRDRIPLLAGMYSVHWTIIPNLVLDIILPPLMHVMPIFWAGKCGIALAVLSPVVGAAAYHRAGFGRLSLWPWMSGVIAYNALVLVGLLNVVISAGFALAGAAIFLAVRKRSMGLRIVTTVASTVVIFFTHIFGVAWYLLLITMEEFAASQSSATPRHDRIKAGLLIAGSSVPVVLLYLASPISTVPSKIEYSFVTSVIWQNFFAFIAYFSVEKLLAIAAVTAIYFLARTKRLEYRKGPLYAAAALFVAAIILPSNIKGTTLVNGRCATMLAFILWSAIRPAAVSMRERRIGLTIVSMILLAKVGAVGIVWRHGNKDLADFDRVISYVPAGAKVGVVRLDRPENLPYWDHMEPSRRLDSLFLLSSHLPALLLIERHAFWPFLFTVLGKQPIIVNPAYAPWQANADLPPAWTILTAPEAKQPPYIKGWAHRYDYVIFLYAGGLKTSLPDSLRLVATSDIANLYRVTAPTKP